MLKKQQPLEDHALTQPQTPPILEIQSQSSNSAQLLHRIISSNQELIHQQMNSIRLLQKENAKLEENLQSISNKYDTLAEVALSKKDNKNSSSILHKQKTVLDQLVQKVINLQQQLSTTKVELAVKSAQLLTSNFQNSHEDAHLRRRQTINSESSRQQFQSFRYNIPNRQQSENRGKGESKQLIDAWGKLCDQYKDQDHKLFRFKQKAASLVKKYVPKQMRGKVWPMCLENRLGMSNSLYIQLLQRRQKGWVCEKVRIQIDKDIKRSFYGKTNYETKTGIILEVVQFLEIFHIFRPDISYIQGMTYPAMILIPMLGKIRAFTLFCNLILGNSFFRKLFSMEGSFVSMVCRGFEILLEDSQPQVGQKLRQMSIQSQIYLIEWLFTLFSRGLSIEATFKFWDHLVIFEQVAIFRMGLSIFQQLGPIILQLSYEQAVNFIREYSHNIKQEKLLQTFASHKLSQQRMYKTFQKVKL